MAGPTLSCNSQENHDRMCHEEGFVKDSYCNLKQVVMEPTTKNNILDLIFTEHRKVLCMP